MVKQPTTTPRWHILLTYGALILTILGGVISVSRATGRMEKAVEASRQVPELQAQLKSMQDTLTEVRKAQTDAANVVATVKSERTELSDAVKRLDEKVNALTNTNGSAWALSQSNAIRLGKLEGMIETMQRLQIQQMQQKER